MAFAFHPTKFDELTNAPLNAWAPMPLSVATLLGRGIVSGGAQLTVLLYLIDRTWGDPRRVPWVRLAVADIARETLLSDSRIEESLWDLLDRGLISALKGDLKFARGVKPRGWEAKKGALSYQCDPAFWELAPKYEPQAASPPGPDDDEDEEPDDSDDEVSDNSDTERHVVLRAGREQTFALRVAPDRAVDFICRSERPKPVRFHLSADPAGGVVRISFPRPQDANLRRVPQALGSPKAKSLNPLEGEIANCVAALLKTHFDLPPDPRLAQRVLRELGDAPAGDYAAFAARAIASMRRRGKPVEEGILVAAARQFLQRWTAAAPERGGLQRLEARARAAGFDEATIAGWKEAGWQPGPRCPQSRTLQMLINESAKGAGA